MYTLVSNEIQNTLSYVLLVFSIWDHLRDSVKTCQMTILITTHYIEEARAANMVSLITNYCAINSFDLSFYKL